MPSAMDGAPIALYEYALVTQVANGTCHTMITIHCQMSITYHRSAKLWSSL